MSSNAWYHWGHWPENVLYTSLWLVYQTEANARLGGVVTKIRDLDGHYFFLTDELSGLAHWMRDTIATNPRWFDDFFALADRTALDVLALEHKDDLPLVLEKSVACLSCSKVVELLDYALQAHLKQDLQRDPAQLFACMRTYKPTHLMQYEEELRALTPTSDISAFTQRYAWVGTHGFKGQALSEAAVYTALERPTPPRSEPAEHSDAITELASKLAYYRSYLVETVDRVTFSYWPVLANLAQTLRVSKDDILLLTFQELSTVMETGRWPADYSLRRHKIGLVNETGVIEVVVSDRLEALLEESFGCRETQTFTAEVKGSSAYPGIARGKARVMKSAQDVGKIEEGDILIATETTPDYILGMKRAAAFVTDQGGITSHAAIVARELQKPCVVGTKIATKVFKDGDLLEVDGTKGVVTRL